MLIDSERRSVLRRPVALSIVGRMTRHDRWVRVKAMRLSILWRGKRLGLERCGAREIGILLTAHGIDWVARKLAVRGSHGWIDRGPCIRMGRVTTHVGMGSVLLLIVVHLHWHWHMMLLHLQL